MLSCEQYDYIEIACMHRYPVLLILKSGQEIKGIATDTTRNEQRQECITLQVEGRVTLVVLDDLVRLTVLVDNPHFTEAEFAAG